MMGKTLSDLFEEKFITIVNANNVQAKVEITEPNTVEKLQQNLNSITTQFKQNLISLSGLSIVAKQLQQEIDNNIEKLKQDALLKTQNDQLQQQLDKLTLEKTQLQVALQAETKEKAENKIKVEQLTKELVETNSKLLPYEGKSLEKLTLEQLSQLQSQLFDSIAKIKEQQQVKLTEKFTQIKDESMCQICMENPKNVVFTPCGHLCVCIECSKTINKCPMCRADILQKIKTFMS